MARLTGPTDGYLWNCPVAAALVVGDLAKVALAGGALPGTWAVLRAMRRAPGLPER